MTTPDQARSAIAARIVRHGVIAVVRLPSADDSIAIADALLEGGCDSIEVTLTTQGALDAISRLRAHFGDRITVGAGSILDEGMAQAAADAGAEYLVSPAGVPAMRRVAHRAGRASMVGGFTPTELLAAHADGTDFVKLFPADTLGPAFLRGVLAPMPTLRVVPTGGISVATAGAWIKAGAHAVGCGNALVDPALVRERQFAALTERAAAFVTAVREAREGSLASGTRA